MGENELASSLNLVEKTWEEIVIEMPEDLETTFRQEECIYKAPAGIRNLNGAAYTPQRLQGQPKEQVLHESLKELLSIIKDREGDIKRCYAASSFQISSEWFPKMILLDAVFIFELFLKSEEYSGDRTMYQDDFIIGKPWLRAAIQRDLILLENQLPFFILEELYNHATSTSYCKATYPPFLDLSCHYFENYGKNRALPGETKQCKPLHFTDLNFNFPGSELNSHSSCKGTAAIIEHKMFAHLSLPAL
ncbi:hypothetical protein OIU77_010092 [Salix suchowensis]|nr:hypothetical protein OIU77_010092 [Salix suchowensis]